LFFIAFIHLTRTIHDSDKNCHIKLFIDFFIKIRVSIQNHFYNLR
jgi:hypothetical protein